MARAKYVHMGMVPLYVGCCLDEATYRAETKRLGVSDPPPFVPDGKNACVHYFSRDKGGVRDTTALMCIDRKSARSRPATQVAALLVHEAVHVMQEGRRVMGGDDHGDEWEAYTVQWVSMFFMDCFAGRC